MSLGVEGSCYPHRGNYLSLDPTYRDVYGRPLVRMTFDFRANEQKMAQFVSGKMMEIARHCGADKVGSLQGLVVPFDSRIYQTTHIVGGTIMGETPHDSVVSPHLQHWDAHNLFVVGASVYPHNSGYNPTGPLAALALRLGDDLLRYLQAPGRL
ncbi:GMC oxidoreductase [Aquitalea magnusonii]|nr:GMC oxidoreductase [Aquitalea magnusonii]